MESSGIVMLAMFLCIYACIHNEFAQAPDVLQETGRAAIFSDVW